MGRVIIIIIKLLVRTGQAATLEEMRDLRIQVATLVAHLIHAGPDRL